MVALKGNDIDRLIADPKRLSGVILIYGPDQGLVAERAAALVAAASGGVDDPFSTVRLDGSEVASDPARLDDEARTLALFGGRRTVWVRDAGSRSIEAAVKPLLDDPPADAVIVIEAGDLKKGTGLRKRVEDHRSALAVPCYADAAADLDKVISEEARAAGLTVDEDARHALHLLLGSDRRLTRSEVAKLCLYAHGRGRIELSDVRAVVGDTGAFALDDAIDAALIGDVASFDREMGRIRAAGTHPSALLTAALRQLHTIARGRLLVDAGTPPAQAVDRMVPPVFFKRKATVARVLSLWPSPRLAAAATRIEDAVVQSRLKPALGYEIAAATLLALATAARAAGRAR